MAVADVPDLELSHVLGFDASADALTASGLASQLIHVGLHCCLTGGVACSGGVDEESAVVLFDHVRILVGQVGCFRVMVDSASGGPQGTTAALLNLLCRQAGTLSEVLRLTPVERGWIVLTEGGEVGANALVVVHAPSIEGVQTDSVIMEDTLSGVTVIHAIALPLAGTFQMTISSKWYFANHTEHRR